VRRRKETHPVLQHSVSDWKDRRETESDEDEGAEAAVLGRARVRCSDGRGRGCKRGESVRKGKKETSEDGVPAAKVKMRVM
jgi:hypothetical protein